jgi:protein TonB
VVARGGTADRGERGATVNGASGAPARVVQAPPGDGLVTAANLSRRATLGEANPCAGYYPSEADDDTGVVTLTLVVSADGVVASSAVIEETPKGQGFGKAARACLQRKRFEPSLDRGGKAVAAATTLRVRFVR